MEASQLDASLVASEDFWRERWGLLHRGTFLRLRGYLLQSESGGKTVVAIRRTGSAACQSFIMPKNFLK